MNKSSKDIEVTPEHGTHILKPEPNEYPEVPQNENACMAMAQELGMDVPPHGLFPMADGKLAYVVKRFDRLPDGSKIHKEDMAQLLALPTDSRPPDIASESSSEKKKDISLKCPRKPVRFFGV